MGPFNSFGILIEVQGGGVAREARLGSGDPVIGESGDRKTKSNPTPGMNCASPLES